MVIAVDARSIFTGMGGIGYYTLHLLRGLAQCDRENRYRVLNFQVPQARILPNPPPNFSFTDFGLFRRKVFNLLTEFFHWPPVQRYLGEVDLVHFPSFSEFPCRKVSYIVTIHDLAFVRYPQFISRRNLRLAQMNGRRLCTGARRIIAVSDATRRDLMELFGVPEEKITVIHSGTDALEWRDPSPEEQERWRRKWGLKKKEFILFVGTIEPRKNLPFLLRAFAQFPYRRDFDLVLAGGLGWYWEEAFETIRQLHLEQDVYHLGYVSQDELAALYAGSTLFVFPSCYEGFGFPPLEAMARGVPVLAANNSSLPEVVGDAGALFELDDPAHLAELMARLVEDPERLATMRERGFQQARCFSWLETARQVKEVYETVCKH